MQSAAVCPESTLELIGAVGQQVAEASAVITAFTALIRSGEKLPAALAGTIGDAVVLYADQLAEALHALRAKEPSAEMLLLAYRRGEANSDAEAEERAYQRGLIEGRRQQRARRGRADLHVA